MNLIKQQWYLLTPKLCYVCVVISETSQIVKAIEKNDFLRRLDEEQISMMVDLMKVLDCRAGDDIIKEGTEGDSMYIVAGVYLRVNYP